MSEEPSKQLERLNAEARAVRNKLWRVGITLTSLAGFLTERYFGLEVKEVGVQPPSFWPYRRGSVNLDAVTEAANIQEILELARKYYELEQQRYELCKKLGVQWAASLP